MSNAKGTVKVNQVGIKRMAPGSTQEVNMGRFRPRMGVQPTIQRASKYDHGQGPKEYTHMNKTTAKTGPSQSPKQVHLSKRGIAKNTGD